ncbi:MULTISPECIES: UvrD-helicase domain-containing protein [unclassified Lysobacter]
MSNSASSSVSSTEDDAIAITDPYLDIALSGVQLIEASAGTGKTFTLATLVTRLVVERDLRLGQILAVTFTDAATQELRARLRKRLAKAARIARALAADSTDPLAGADPGNPGLTGDGAVIDACAHDDPESRLTRTIIQRQLQHEDANVLAARLHRAELEIDLAAVFTIHGFCLRVLSEHALLTGQAFSPPELIGNDRELRDEVAADLWRSHGAQPDDAPLLHVLWSAGPEALAQDLGALLRAPELMPPRPNGTPDPLPDLERAAVGLRTAFAEHGDDLRKQLDDAIANKVLNGNSYRAGLPDQLWAELRGWCVAGVATADIDDRISRLTPGQLALRTNKDRHAGTPTSPLCEAVAGFIAAREARGEWLAAQALILLHRIRDEAAARLRQLKRTRRVQGYDDLIDGVADALEGPHGDELARQLRAQYAIALVDEFQDTDARQWGIFRRVFGPDSGAVDAATGATDAGPALFLIGDPKQAIYGFRGGNVHTYLAASRDAVIAPPLTHNFRSRPGVLRAIEALYTQAGEDAFIDSGIRFRKVEPGAGNSDADYQRNGANAPALTVRQIPVASDDKPYKADESRAAVTRACVAEIHAVLGDARAGKATIKGQPVQPGDIAVLVRDHSQASRMQAALVNAGIAAVAAGKQSLFQSEQANELLAVLEALLQPADEGRLRAALATVLVGIDAAGIDRLDHDDDWRQQQQMQALGWRERWQRHGVMALVSELCAANAERLLGLVDGERRLTNLMQLGELLQEAGAKAVGMHGLLDWLHARIADADPNDDTQLLRLESDARRVQILTLHKSKGLEFPLVFLPFVGIGRKPGQPARHCQVPDECGGVLHWKAGDQQDPALWVGAVEDWQREQQAEDARLLYVGLTRTRHALWLACGPLYQSANASVQPMLADAERLREHADIVVDEDELPASLPPLAAQSSSAVPPARIAQRNLPRDWWVYSFTQLSKADAGLGESTSAASIANERGASDEPVLDEGMLDEGTFEEGTLEEGVQDAAEGSGAEPVAPVPLDQHFDHRFSGSRFGNVLHDALEHVDFHAWSGWRAAAAPEGQAAPLAAALRRGGYPDADIDEGVVELTSLVGRTLTVTLAEGGRLCELPPDARRAELEFHFAMQPTSTEALLSILHAHGVVSERRAFGARRQLEGLMTGKIDLTYTRDARWYLLDYKSNRLPGYDAANVARAMTHSEYDLQALVYTVALHRWLRFRLGGDYDYERDFGGTRYLFCRGLAIGTSTGIHAAKPAFTLVDGLDALFEGGANR